MCRAPSIVRCMITRLQRETNNIRGFECHDDNFTEDICYSQTERKCKGPSYEARKAIQKRGKWIRFKLELSKIIAGLFKIFVQTFGLLLSATYYCTCYKYLNACVHMNLN